MDRVADYSSGMPGAFSIRDAGFIGAVRYIGFPDRPKCTNRGELDAFKAAGLSMALVYEDQAGDWKTGEGGGKAGGRRARNHARSIGFPDACPVYMAIDQDLVQPMDFAIMIRYLKGANQELGGPQCTGVYGEADVIDRARDAGVAGYFWQTVAWSNHRITESNLYQHSGWVTVNGIKCDISDVKNPDWGQYPREGTTVLSETEYRQITDRVVAAIKNEVLAGDWRFDGNRNPMDMARQTVATGFQNEATLNAHTASLAAIYTAVTTVRDRPAVTVDAQAVAAELKAQGVQGVTQEGVETALRNVLRTGTNG